MVSSLALGTLVQSERADSRSFHSSLYRCPLCHLPEAIRHKHKSSIDSNRQFGFSQLWSAVRRFSIYISSLTLALQHLILDIIRAIEAFVELESGGALQYYSDLSNPLQAAKTAIMSL